MAVESTIYVFLAVAAIFYTVAAVQTSRFFLIPAGVTLILLGSFIPVTGGVKVNTGDKNIIIENKSAKTTFENRTTTFRTIDRNAPFNTSNLLAIILIVTGMASMILGVNKKGRLRRYFR